LKFLGFLLIGGGALLLFLIYGPIIKEEVSYQERKITLSRSEDNGTRGVKKEVTPVSEDFGLMIERLGINVQVFADTDANNPKEYLPILLKGVAHAKGSVFPGQEGNVFIFAHSSNAPLSISRYNAVFYLIDKLESGDGVDIFYQGSKYKYEVTEKVIATPDMVAPYVKEHATGKSLTLQTCYPAGTALKRLLVIAKEID